MADLMTVTFTVGANELTSRSYTNSCSPMWILAGTDLIEYDGTRALNALPELQAAVASMENTPADYEALNPSDGSGDYDGCLAFIQGLVDDCNHHPKAFINAAITAD